VLDGVLESTDDGILMADSAGRPVVGNRRWAALLGGPGLELPQAGRAHRPPRNRFAASWSATSTLKATW
jgi:PAS domain-containing protein